MKIKEVKLNDINHLVPLFDGYMVFYGKPSNPISYRDFLVERIKNKEAYIFIAFDDDEKAMGFTLLYPSFSSVSQRRIFILNDLFVHKDHRKKGVASGLINTAAAYGRKNKAVRLHLETDHDNVTAQRLYESSGWIKDSSFHYSLEL